MFKDVVLKLLEGAFICHTAYPDLFDYLGDESAQRDVDDYIGRMGRRLTRTANGEAFYAAHTEIGPAQRTEVRALFKEIKHEFRPVLGFLNLVMRAQQSDVSLSSGDVIDFSRLLGQVTDSPHLGEALRVFASLGSEYASSDPSLRAMLDRVLQRLVKNGYLVTDRERDRYKVTGKIDYFYEVLEFLAENEDNIQDATDTEPEVDTGRLI